MMKPSSVPRARLLVAFGASLEIACGLTTGKEADVGAPRVDASPQDGSAEDGPQGSPDAGPDSAQCSGNTLCATPTAVCINASTLRWYTSVCKDGTCEQSQSDIVCTPTGIEPDCLDGGCRLTLVR